MLHSFRLLIPDPFRSMSVSPSLSFACGVLRVVADGTRLARAARCAPRGKDEVGDVVNAGALLHAREQRRAVAAHDLRVALHDVERRADVRRQVDLRTVK